MPISPAPPKRQEVERVGRDLGRRRGRVHGCLRLRRLRLRR